MEIERCSMEVYGNKGIGHISGITRILFAKKDCWDFLIAARSAITYAVRYVNRNKNGCKLRVDRHMIVEMFFQAGVNMFLFPIPSFSQSENT